MTAIKRSDFDRLVREFLFAELFNKLGWNTTSFHRDIKTQDQIFPLHGIAEKSGFFVMHCQTDNVPLLSQRRHINTVFSKVKDFHLIIYTDKARMEQRWQFVLRVPNRPAKNIEVNWKKGQDTEALWQRTRGLFFSLDEEDNITIVDVSSRVTEAFGANTDRVTKKFYDSFKNEHEQFLEFIAGISALADKQWYASLMLNRLMFCYFIQKKGFLDNNPNYLSDKLAQTRERRGQNTFYSFYRDFLLVLFHQGLNEPLPRPETHAEIGQVPYLNGGLFDVHELENLYDIQIPDEAFENIFRFFDQWEWHLDTRPDASAKEINPDVIGFIFEKYINERADMGAYYTKEDITSYIGRNCIIPFLFDQAERNGARLAPCREIARQSGDRYIFPALRHGISWDLHRGQPLEAPLPLPPDIEEGLDTDRPGLIGRRQGWNREAPPEYGLPTEWWRETVERRLRYAELRRKIDGGEVQAINDFITLNLDIRAYAQDCLEQTEDPDFLWAFYRGLSSVSVLDPTCGSGAFLFAALNILEPLYEACLDRMAAFVEGGEAKHRTHFSTVLEEAADTTRHPSREYYVYKKIIVNNLYGVDLMHEAVEIAKLRLFLKLMSTVQPDRRRPNLGLEPLPDVDFNLRNGNALVGFATLTETIDAINQRDLPPGAQGRLVFGEELEVIAAVREKAELIGMAYKRFKDSQLLLPNGGGLREAKAELNLRLRDLAATLDEYLAYQYGIYGARERKKMQEWKKSHQPFHWWAEFYEVLYDEEGKFKGFDVVIGNPPYVEYSKSRKGYSILNYATESSGNLFAFVTERSNNLLYRLGRLSLIVPISLVCTQRMEVLQDIALRGNTAWLSNYAERPGKLFSGAEVILTICIIDRSANETSTYVTGFNKWNSAEREFLFQRISYVGIPRKVRSYIYPKISNELELKIFDNFLGQKVLGNEYSGVNGSRVYYRIGGGRYWKIFTNFQPKFFQNGTQRTSSRENYLFFKSDTIRDAAIAGLSSTLFYWYFMQTTNCRDLNPSDLKEFPFPASEFNEPLFVSLQSRTTILMQDYEQFSELKNKVSKLTGEIIYQEFYPRLSKPIIDQIDTVLAEHYGFTEEELDFIINYDIKYRMGRSSGEEE